MNADEKRGYSRGYFAGSHRKWPDHRPPRPPDEMVSAFIAAATKLRDQYDDLLATTGPDAELEALLGPGIDALDAAARAMGVWIRSGEIKGGG